MNRAIALGACMVLAMLGACSNTPRGAEAGPAWFKDSVREANQTPYPRLEDVPVLSTLARPTAHWDALEVDLAKDQAALAASPRSAPVPPDAAAAGEQFEAEARQALAERPASP